MLSPDTVATGNPSRAAGSLTWLSQPAAYSGRTNRGTSEWPPWRRTVIQTSPSTVARAAPAAMLSPVPSRAVSATVSSPYTLSVPAVPVRVSPPGSASRSPGHGARRISGAVVHICTPVGTVAGEV